MTLTSTLAAPLLNVLRSNPYPGRGFVVGLNEMGDSLIQVYWIMGRSENSRNRVFEKTGGRVCTQPADPSKVTDPSLIIYNVMDEAPPHYVVSNGHQTDEVTAAMETAYSFEQALKKWTYEPDAPNFTPRITALSVGGRKPSIELSIISKAKDSADKVSHFYRYNLDEMKRGMGHCLTTYKGDGDPLPSFEGPPLLLPLHGDIMGVLHAYWGALNAQNRVALAVKFINIDSKESQVRIINRFEKISS